MITPQGSCLSNLTLFVIMVMIILDIITIIINAHLFPLYLFPLTTERNVAQHAMYIHIRSQSNGSERRSFIGSRTQAFPTNNQQTTTKGGT